MINDPRRPSLPALLSASLVATLVLSAAPARADMNINVGKLSADGLEVRNLSCSLKDGGLFGALAIVGALGKQRKAFDACAKDGAAFAVEFVWSKDGKAGDAKVTSSSDAKANACVLSALKKVKPTVSGSCSTVILAGNTAKAEAAAATLKKDAAPAK